MCKIIHTKNSNISNAIKSVKYYCEVYFYLSYVKYHGNASFFEAYFLSVYFLNNAIDFMHRRKLIL